MLSNYLNRPRKKAWIGAAISAGVGIASSIFGASAQKRAQQKQFNLQQNNQAREAGLQSAANLTKTFANYNELNQEFQNRFLRYGGRRRAELGIEEKENTTLDSDTIDTGTVETKVDTSTSSGKGWSAGDTNDIISGVGSAIGNIAGSLIANSAKRSGKVYTPIKTSIRNVGDNQAVYDSASRSQLLNDYYRTAMMKLGGRSRRC